jgi:hypothetical protein
MRSACARLLVRRYTVKNSEDMLMCFIGAHSVMIATAAESNPSCFSPRPLVDLERTLVLPYLRLVSEIIELEIGS